MTDKPTVFLSHASADATALRALKEVLREASHGSIDIFLSSDGQSIPLGRNWVSEVVQALNRAKLMFVFLTPAALRSSWVLFEAGYAYAKEIRVVPVALSGVDLSALTPPLSLLQGFNLTDASRMNNLVNVINEQFQLTIPETLTEEDFGKTLQRDQDTSSSLLGAYGAWVEAIKFLVKNADTDHQELAGFLAELDIGHVKSPGGVFSTNGLEIVLRDRVAEIGVDPPLTGITFPILENVIPFLSNSDGEGRFQFELRFPPGVRRVDEMFTLTGRIYGSGMELADHGRLRLGELYLDVQRVDPRPDRPAACLISCTYPQPSLSEAPLAEALKILIETRSLYYVNS